MPTFSNLMRMRGTLSNGGNPFQDRTLPVLAQAGRTNPETRQRDTGGHRTPRCNAVQGAESPVQNA